MTRTDKTRALRIFSSLLFKLLGDEKEPDKSNIQHADMPLLLYICKIYYCRCIQELEATKSKTRANTLREYIRDYELLLNIDFSVCTSGHLKYRGNSVVFGQGILSSLHYVSPLFTDSDFFNNTRPKLKPFYPWKDNKTSCSIIFNSINPRIESSDFIDEVYDFIVSSIDKSNTPRVVDGNYTKILYYIKSVFARDDSYALCIAAKKFSESEDKLGVDFSIPINNKESMSFYVNGAPGPNVSYENTLLSKDSGSIIHIVPDDRSSSDTSIFTEVSHPTISVNSNCFVDYSVPHALLGYIAEYKQMIEDNSEGPELESAFVEFLNLFIANSFFGHLHNICKHNHILNPDAFVESSLSKIRFPGMAVDRLQASVSGIPSRISAIAGSGSDSDIIPNTIIDLKHGLIQTNAITCSRYIDILKDTEFINFVPKEGSDGRGPKTLFQILNSFNSEDLDNYTVIDIINLQNLCTKLETSLSEYKSKIFIDKNE